jgi:hypothetical protein
MMLETLGHLFFPIAWTIVSYALYQWNRGS